MNDLSGMTTIVVGASRGLGRGIATAFAEAGAPVVAVSRTLAGFPQPAGGAGAIRPEVADAADATVPARLFDRYFAWLRRDESVFRLPGFVVTSRWTGERQNHGRTES